MLLSELWVAEPCYCRLVAIRHVLGMAPCTWLSNEKGISSETELPLDLAGADGRQELSDPSGKLWIVFDAS
jgi:hypothetical protein